MIHPLSRIEIRSDRKTPNSANPVSLRLSEIVRNKTDLTRIRLGSATTILSHLLLEQHESQSSVDFESSSFRLSQFFAATLPMLEFSYVLLADTTW